MFVLKLSPTFQIGDAVVVDPAISSGLPLPAVNRQPPPGSRPEKYTTPATQASDPAQNPYWKRDVRRAYPQLSVVTQSELSTLLIQHSGTPELLVAPSGPEATSVPATTTPRLGLSEAISTIGAARKAYATSALPPTPPTPFKRWVPQHAPDAPHDPNAYFPMILVK